MDREYYGEEQPKKRLRKTIVRAVIALVLASVFMLLFARMFAARPRGVYKHITFTPETAQAYTESGGALHVYEQQLKSYISATGFLQVRNVHYVQESRELQMTVYYNAYDSSAADLTEDDPFPFQFLLHLSASSDPYEEYSSELVQTLEGRVECTDQKWMYRFARVTFHDVDPAQQDAVTGWLHLMQNGESRDAMLVYHRDMDRTDYPYERYVPKDLRIRK